MSFKKMFLIVYVLLFFYVSFRSTKLSLLFSATNFIVSLLYFQIGIFQISLLVFSLIIHFNYLKKYFLSYWRTGILLSVFSSLIFIGFELNYQSSIIKSLTKSSGGDVENIQSAIENLIISCGCKVIVLDPIHDVISSLPLDEQENFMSWQKGMVKSHTVTFLNVCHTRKTSGGQKAGSAGADLHEEDLMGNSGLYKSAACNLMFSRNKEATDSIEKNTTIMKATKIRWTGKTGIAGRYYYDNEKHTLYDLDDWMEENGPTEF